MASGRKILTKQNRAPVFKPPRKPFAEVLAAFMEQSNIRWGEIIGGLLIIGCSTALVISLWAQISRVPVMKFLIFTTVTAALFGVGFYTEHHWKLPTTSRGILTIATLLVPLNFLAIAAVSAGWRHGSALVIGSRTHRAGSLSLSGLFCRPGNHARWPHLLAAGALGSSVGQLLIRHFAAPDNSAGLVDRPRRVPGPCYVIATGWMLKIALADGRNRRERGHAIFITLGALTFAAVLPFGLLLYKVGFGRMRLMHLAPLVTLGGAPLLATGLLLWHACSEKNWRRRAPPAPASRSWECGNARRNGSGLAKSGEHCAGGFSIFCCFTAVAGLLEEPRAHVIAAGCLTFAYLVAFHVLAGHVPGKTCGSSRCCRSCRA